MHRRGEDGAGAGTDGDRAGRGRYAQGRRRRSVRPVFRQGPRAHRRLRTPCEVGRSLDGREGHGTLRRTGGGRPLPRDARRETCSLPGGKDSRETQAGETRCRKAGFHLFRGMAFERRHEGWQARTPRRCQGRHAGIGRGNRGGTPRDRQQQGFPKHHQHRHRKRLRNGCRQCGGGQRDHRRVQHRMRVRRAAEGAA